MRNCQAQVPMFLSQQKPQVPTKAKKGIWTGAEFLNKLAEGSYCYKYEEIMSQQALNVKSCQTKAGALFSF